MANRTPFTAENPITLEMLNSFVQGAQVVPQTNINEIELWTKSAIESELATKADKSNFTKFIFNDSVTTLKDGYTYYGSTISDITVSSGTYYFYNCTGNVAVSGTSAKVYAANCPNLTINGKTASNWQNIWIDGVASRQDGVVTQYSNGTMIVSETTYPNTSGTIQYTFPVAFIAEPVTNITVFFNSRYPSIERQTETFVKYTVWWEAGQANAEYVNIRAIGRWKS